MPDVAWRAHPDGTDWLYRPAERGWCSYVDIKEGRVDLADIAVMNDHIDVIEDNRRLADEAMRDG